MKTNTKQIAFVVIGLLIVSAVFTFSKLNMASAAKTDGKKFDDWMVSCKPADEKTNTPEMCLLNQQVNVTQEDKTQQPMALYQIGYFGPQKELKLIQTLPLGIRIEAGTSIISSKKLIAPGKYTTCIASGCQAVVPLSDADLKALLSNSENAVAFMNLEGKQLTLPLSIKGLEEGLNYIK